MEAVVSTASLAEELGVTPETVVRWIKEKRIHGAYHRRGRWHIPVEEAESFAQKYEGAPDDEVYDEDEEYEYEYEDDEDEEYEDDE